MCLLSEFKCQFMCACYLSLYIYDVNLSTRTPLITLRSRLGNIGVLYKTLTYNYEVIAFRVLFFLQGTMQIYDRPSLLVTRK